jgi:hypothetical protein
VNLSWVRSMWHLRWTLIRRHLEKLQSCLLDHSNCLSIDLLMP